MRYQIEKTYRPCTRRYDWVGKNKRKFRRNERSLVSKNTSGFLSMKGRIEALKIKNLMPIKYPYQN